jgi:hypothetical protein
VSVPNIDTGRMVDLEHEITLGCPSELEYEPWSPETHSKFLEPYLHLFIHTNKYLLSIYVQEEEDSI